MSARTLFVSTFAPALGSGRALRTFTCVKALAQLGPVDFVYHSHDGSRAASEYLALETLRLHEVAESRGARRAAIYAHERLRGTPASCARGTGPELIDAVERLAPGAARIVAGDTHAATGLLRTKLPFVYNAHNIEANRISVDARRERAQMLRYERRLLRTARESWMVSRADLETARELVPEARLRYVPNVVDVRAITPRELTPGGDRIAMIGDFTYGPNRSARDYLVDELLPRIRAHRPQAQLTLVGRGLEEWRPTRDGVTATGFVDDIADAYAGADCVVVPLIEGAGSPLKFVEALAYGMPIVATPLAAAGLDVHAGVEYLEGTDADSFAAAVASVLRDGGAELGAAARALAERDYSVESLVRRIAS